MKSVILLVGKNGLIGRQLARFLPSVGEVVAMGRQQLDVTNQDEIRRVTRAVRPQIIVNATAFKSLDLAESDPAAARAVNADAPRWLAEEAKKIGAGLVHYSTDCVFDGTKAAPYLEEDPHNPINVYGQTKLDGELAVLRSGVPHLIFRVARVYGREEGNFLTTVLRLSTQREELKMVCDQVGSPTWNREIARRTTDILAQLVCRTDGLDVFGGASGVYNMATCGETSWSGFASAILQEASECRPARKWFQSATQNLPLSACRIVPITTAEFPTPARRPANSVLSNARLARTFQIQMPDWRTQLHDFFAR
jgi:dTDP-4-dehydrorhamnose reductase